MMPAMERFITDIDAYCAASGIEPPALLKAVVGATWRTWDRWQTGASSPTMRTVDRLRAYMVANPPPQPYPPSE